MVSRNDIPGNANISITNSGGTSTQNTGPSTSNQFSSSSSNQSTSGSSSSSTKANRVTETNNKQTTTNQNMDDASFAALQNLIQNLASGGSESDQLRYQQIQEQIGASRLQEQVYSKDMAFSDANRVANSQSEEALKKLMPTITAGIDAAGTSGSAVASLLTQEAANNAANLAAKLSLDTAVNYGQIKNQAMGNTTDLLAIDDPVMSQLLDALNIAKGVKTSQTVDTKGRTTENYNEVTNSSQSQRSSGSQTGFSTTANSGGTVTTNTGPSTETRTSLTPSKSGPVQFPGLNTPSSYSSGNRSNPYVTVV